MYVKLLFNDPVKIKIKTCFNIGMTPPSVPPQTGREVPPFPFWGRGQGDGVNRKIMQVNGSKDEADKPSR